MRLSSVKHLLVQGLTCSNCSINGKFLHFRAIYWEPTVPRMMPDALLGQAVNTRFMVSIEKRSSKWENQGDGWGTSDWCSRKLLREGNIWTETLMILMSSCFIKPKIFLKYAILKNVPQRKEMLSIKLTPPPVRCFHELWKKCCLSSIKCINICAQ